jgi:hypothetical protein
VSETTQHAIAHYNAVLRRKQELRSRDSLDPRDPEALEQTERMELETLEEWEV